MPLPTVPYENNKAPTKEEIMEKLREWIISLKFAPGEKIADTDIAAYFNVSRTPVREVLKVLEIVLFLPSIYFRYLPNLYRYLLQNHKYF